MLRKINEISSHTLTRVALVILLFSLFGATLVTVFEGDINDQFGAMGDGIWWVLVTMTTVGYGDKVPVTMGGKIVGVFVMFAGVAILSLFTATISSIFVTRKIKEGRGLENIKWKDHLIICGWNFSVEQILFSLERARKKVKSVVLVNQLSEESIGEIIHRFSSLKIKYVRGDFSKEVTLHRANVHAAKAVIIFPDSSSGLGSKSDEQTVLSVLNIKSMNPKLKVYAYVLDRENLSHIRKAKADEVLVSDSYAGFLMASHILSPGVPQLIHQLCSEDSPSTLVRLDIPELFHGKTYGELTETLIKSQKILPLGIGEELEGVNLSNILSDDYSYLDQFIMRKFEEAGRGLTEENRITIRINPSADTRIDPKDFLIAISQGENV